MKVAKPVLFAVVLSFLPLAIAQNGHPSRSRVSGPREPTGPVSALVTVVSLQDSAEGRFAIMRINLVANTSDTTATVDEFDPAGKRSRGAPLALLDLKKGEARSVLVRVAVPRNQESHFFYKVKARATDGSISELTLYNRIPSDEPDPCQEVDEYIQCQGAAVAGVEP